MGNYASYTDGNPPADTDVFLISRNGTGTRRYTYLQLRSALAALFETAGAVAAHVAAGDPHTQYALDSALGTIASQNANNVAITGGAVSDVDLNLKNETVAAEGDLAYNATTEELNYHNGQRALTDAVGWTPRAYPLGYGQGNGVFSTSLALAASSGTMVVPVEVTGHMLFETLMVHNRDVASLRTASWRLYRQRLNNGNSGENTVDEVSGANGTFSFTPGAASNVSSSVGSPPVYLAPGIYWLALQNTANPNTFSVGVMVPNTSGPNPTFLQTKTLGSALGSTLDMVAATWTKSTTNIPGIVLQGRVFGETAVW